MRALVVVAAFALASVGLVGATTAPAFANHCDVWAMLDRPDRSTRLYAAGGFICPRREAGFVRVTIYRGDNDIASSEGNICNDIHSRCSAYTRRIWNPRGRQRFCARTYVDYGWHGAEARWRCRYL
ncbi:MAG: hypothetical protein M3165_05255 [Actinomycetota bacterium]|nr:hypothetical protein [Actinomycetota bacterium]